MARQFKDAISTVGGISTSANITTTGNGSHSIGSTSNRFSGIYGANIYAYDANAQHYASLRTTTVGTADTQGVGRLIAGNNVASGTAGNAKGQVLLYGTNTGYTALTPGNDTTSNATIELPSVGGKLMMCKADANNYWGMLPPTGTTDCWMRSPESGLLPYDNTMNSSLGGSAYVWKSAFVKTLNIYGSSGQTYGNFNVATVGTTSTVGESRITIGNSIAEGTDKNSYGRIAIYGKKKGYTWIQPGNNSDSNITVELPSASGKIPIAATDADGYWGILPPTGSETTWLRSPKSGLIPFEKGGASSSLGSASWPWKEIHGTNVYVSGTDTKVYARMFSHTLGTTSTVGIGMLQLGNSYAEGTASNSYGYVRLYGKDTGYTNIIPGNNTTSNITLNLPSSGGTLARTSDNVASATKLNTARTLTIGATGKTFDGSGNVSWTLHEIMKGQGLNYDTACNTLYFNNGGTSHKGRLSCYNDNGSDYVQIALRTADASDNYIALYAGRLSTKGNIKSGAGYSTAAGGITLNEDKNATYYPVDVHRKCDSGSAEYSTARFGCVNSYGGCAAIETRHDGTTVGYVRALPNGGIQIGSGKKLHIQNSAPTANVATGDVWIDAG